MFVDLTLTTVILLVVAFLNVVTAWLAYLTRKDVRVLEINTNSKLDQIMAEAKLIAFAAGRAEAKEENRVAEKGD